jgi:hypothetical protein
MEAIKVRRLILHPGSPKTGTTSLQNFLFRHRGELLEKGFLYPEAGVPTAGGTAKGHHHLALLMQDGEPTDRVAEMMAGLRREVAQSPDRTLILSSEEFFGARRISNLAKWIEAETCLVYVCLRPQHEVMNANYYTQVSYNRLRQPPEAYFRFAIGRLLYRAVLDSAAMAAPQTTVKLRLFERGQPARSSPVQDFLGVAGVPLGYEPSQNVVEHPTLPARATLLLRFVNEFDLPPDAYFKVFSRLHQMRAAFGPEQFTLSPALARDVIARFAAENRAIRQTYLDGKDEDLFAPAALPDDADWERQVGQDHRHVEQMTLIQMLEMAAAPKRGD